MTYLLTAHFKKENTMTAMSKGAYGYKMIRQFRRLKDAKEEKELMERLLQPEWVTIEEIEK